MNNARRKQIRNLLCDLEDLGLEGKLEDLKSGFEGARDEEQEYYDNMPEGLQGSEKGQMAEAAISALDEILSALDEAIGSLGEISGYVDNATE